MNIKRAKKRFWDALWPPVIVESPFVRNPLVEFALGLFEKEEEKKEKKDAEEYGR